MVLTVSNIFLIGIIFRGELAVEAARAALRGGISVVSPFIQLVHLSGGRGSSPILCVHSLTWHAYLDVKSLAILHISNIGYIFLL